MFSRDAVPPRIRHDAACCTPLPPPPIQAEIVVDSELHQFFVAPGYYGPDVLHMREYEKSRAEFRKIPVRWCEIGVRKGVRGVREECERDVRGM